MSPGRHLLLDERGVALPLAMIVLVALTMMVLASLTLAGVEPQISQNLTDTARAGTLLGLGKLALGDKPEHHQLLTQALRSHPTSG